MTKITWGGNSGDWSDNADWQGGAAPGATDDVYLSVSGGYTVSLTTPISVASVTISDSGAALSISDPGQVESVTGDFSNSGAIYVDNTYGDAGGSTLTIGGTLTSSGYLQIGGYSASGTVNAQGLANTGTIDIINASTLDVTVGTAPSTWTGVLNDSGLLEYSGTSQIASIASGAQINLSGAGRVADAGIDLSTSSALEGLASNAGQLALGYGDAVTTNVGLNNTGNIYVDNTYGNAGGSALTIGGTLTNGGYLQIGGYSASGTVNAQGLANTGRIDIINASTLDVSGPASSSGTINIGGSLDVTGGNAFTITGGATNVSGALAAATIDITGGLLDFSDAITSASGTGNFEIAGNGVLDFGAAVDAGHVIDFTSTAGVLDLGAPGQFAATIANFSEGDKIDLLHTVVTGVSYASGVLTVLNGASTVATLNLAGNYSSADFIHPSDGSGGTYIELAQNAAQATIEKTSGSGTLTQGGTNYTLDFGTVAYGSGPLTANLEVLNSGPAPADTLSGSFSVSANAAFSNAGLSAFSNVAAGQADTAPSITFTPGAAGTFSETITLSPASDNGAGSTPIPVKTLTVTGTVAAAPPPSTPPVITAPGFDVVGNNIESPVDGISVAPGAGMPADTQITLTLSEASGGLDFWFANGADAASTEAASNVTLTGTAAYLNQMLSELVYTGGASSIAVSATEDGKTSNATVSLVLPTTNDPTEPYAQPVSILLQNGSSVVAFGGSTANPGTAALLQWDQGGAAYVGKVYVNLPLVSGYPSVIGFAGTDGLNAPIGLGLGANGQQEPFSPEVGAWSVALNSASIPVPNAEDYSLGTVTDSSPQQPDTITLTFNSTPLGSPALPDRRVVVVFNKPGGIEIDGPDDGDDGEDDDGGDGGSDGGGDGGTAVGDIHLTTYNHVYYNFQGEGEFTLAKSTKPGDAFDVQIRTHRWFNSAAVSVTTAVGVAVGGGHRVTFEANRADTVWIDGSAAGVSGLTPGGPAIHIGSASLKQLTPNSWQITYATGESATVSNSGNFLNVDTTLPRSAVSGAYAGLLGNANGNPADNFTLPNGTVLTQPLSYTDLYTTWADAWRLQSGSATLSYALGQTDSLFDYGAAQTTATFTDKNFPSDALSLSALPNSVQQNALAAAAAAGITDPAVAQGAALDYALTGDPAFLAADKQGATQVILSPDPTNPNAAQAVGVAAVSSQVTENASGPTQVNFIVYRTGSDVSNPVTVNYAVEAPNSGYLGASDFAGDALPSGTVTIAAGATSASLALSVTGSVGNTPSAQLEVGVSTDAGGPPVVGATASVTVVNANAVPGVAAEPAFIDRFGVGTFTQAGSNWTLALGTISVDSNLPVLALEIANLASAPADTLFGVLQSSGSGLSFQSGLPSIVGLVPGQTQAFDATLNTKAPGQINETLIFNANERNSSGYSAAITPITLTITGNVTSAAVAAINTASPIALGNVHVGDAATKPLSVTNSANAPAAGLDATFGPAPAGLSATGAISQLAPQGVDAKNLSIGLDTSSAGAKSGTIKINFASDTGGGKSTPLPSQTIDVNGLVYRLAASVIAPLSTVVHVGDTGSANLSVNNVALADGYSENLVASLAGSSGAITVSGGSTGEITPQGSDNDTFKETYSTAQAGVLSGSATFNIASDGGTGAGSIDGLGQTTLTQQTAPLSVTVNNYANPAFELVSGVGSLSRNGNSFTLDLGTISHNSGALTVGLGVLNNVTGPADLLAGLLQASGSASFSASGLDSFAGLGAGQADTAPSVTLNTNSTGQQTETITLTPTGSNASGYSGALATETLTITGTVIPAIPDLTVVQYLANPSAADSAPDGFDITDTAAKVSTIFDALNADAQLDKITLTDTGTPSLTLTASQALDDTTALGKINNASYLIAILDTAADVAAKLDALQANPHVTAITLTDPSDPLAVSVAQLTSDAGALGELTNGYSLAVTGSAAAIESGLPTLTADAKHIGSITASDSPPSFSTAIFVADEPTLDKIVGGFAISDTAKHIQDNLPALLADASHIDSIAASETVGVSAATFIADRAALDKIAGGFGIVDTAADIKSYLDFLSDPSIVAVTISDNAAVGANVAQLTSDAATIDELRNANGSAYQLAISDTAANVQNGIATLAANTHIGSITASGGPASFSTAIFAADKPTLDKIVGGFGIADTAAKVSGSLDALQGDVADIASIKFSDASPPTLNITSAQLAADAAVLAKIASPYILDVANASGSSSYVGYGNGLVFNIGGGTTSTIKGGGLNESFVFGAGFKTATISEFATHGGVASNDTISLAKSDFADWATLLADAHTGAGGSVSFVSQSGATLTLAGVSVAAFEKPGAPYKSEFSFHA